MAGSATPEVPEAAAPASQTQFTIEHIATGLKVTLDSYFFTEFQDTIDTKYNTTYTYGRMDPIVAYQGSSRKISVGIKITPNSTAQSTTLNQLTQLQKMQYPVYQKGENALTIQRPPLVRVKLANLIRDGGGGALICAMNGFAFTPNVGFTPADSPFVRFGDAKTEPDTMEMSTSQVTFVTYNLKFDFTVLHQQPMGFSDATEVKDIYDPDDVVEAYQKEMKFLGGYAFGPRTMFLNEPAEITTAADALGLNTPHGGAAADTADGVATGGHGRGARNPSR
jgi:hypothetical protein